MPVVLSTFTGFNDSSFGFNSEPLFRGITLVATPLENNTHIIDSDRIIVGEITENIFTEDASTSFLNITRSGTFVIIKDFPVPLEIGNPLDPNS